MNYATRFERLIAYIIDVLIIYLIAVGLGVIFKAAFIVDNLPESAGLVSLIYFPVQMVCLKGQTLGLIFKRLRLVSKKNETLPRIELFLYGGLICFPIVLDIFGLLFILTIIVLSYKLDNPLIVLDEWTSTRVIKN